MKIGKFVLLLSAFLALGHSLSLGNVAPVDSPAVQVSAAVTVQAKHEVVLIEDNVADWELLAAQAVEARPDAEVVRLDSKADGIEQITAILRDRKQLDGIHIISHGASGQVLLGSSRLSAASLDENAALLRVWGQSLKAGAGILLYGCEVAKDAAGLTFITNLAAATGADVAASSNPTGAALRGGDWDLEMRTGSIRTDAFDSGMEYEGLLETVTFVEDSQEDEDANANSTFTRTVGGVTFTFAAGSTVTSTTADYLDIDSNSGFTGIYALSSRNATNGVDFSITAPAGYTFDLTGFLSASEVLSITIFYVKNGITESEIMNIVDLPGINDFSGLTDFDDVTEVVLTAEDYTLFQDLLISDVKAIVSPPVVTAVSIPNAAMKIGDTVTVTITVASDVDNYTTGSGGISGNIGGFTLGSLSKTNDTTYTATFTVSSGGTDVAAGSNIPLSVTLTNSSGSAGTAFTTAISQASDPIDANRPVISAVSIPDAAMNLGDVVTATLTVTSDADTYTLGTSTIAGYTLANLSKTNNTTYTATFTIAVDADIAAGSDIPLSVILNDSAGNASTAFTTAISQGSDPINAAAIVPDAPTIGTATAGNTQASVAFTAPASDGGAAIIDYTVTSSPGNITATGATSPITVTGLSNGTDYTFTVTATNSAGTGAASAASNSVTPKASQTITFVNPGAQNFGTAPTLSATSDSSLTVTFSSSTTGVCTIDSGGVLTFLSAGTCTINADQAGNSSYLAATQVPRSFTVNAIAPAAPTIGTATAGDSEATVTFTAPASNGGAAIIDYAVTSSPGNIVVTGASSPLTVTGLTNGVAYTFTVTATNSAGTSSASAASDPVIPDSAQAVIYDGNGNTGGTAPVDDDSPYVVGTTVTVLGNTGSLVRTGYTFAGWNSAANGSGTDYSPGATFSISAALTLYAQWTPASTYSVTYVGNNNTAGAAPVDGDSPYLNGTTVTVLGNSGSLVRTGFTFAGWNTAANGSGTDYAPASTFSMGSANVILYAKWTALNYAVTYDANGATGGTAPTDGSSPYASGSTVTVLGNTGNLVRTGFTFAGWNSAANGSGTDHAPAATFSITGNMTLYAKWAPITHTVTYDANGATGGIAPVDGGSPYLSGTTVTVLGNTGSLVRTGFTFAGWNSAANGSGTDHAPAATFSITGNMTLYAKWTPISYTLVYDGNGHTGGTVPLDAASPYSIGATATVLGNTGNLVRYNHAFTGWNTAPSGVGTHYSPGALLTPTAPVTLYAMWAVNTHSVSYDGNGHTGGTVPVDASLYSSGATVTVPGNSGNLVREGFTFEGWNTAANGSGTSYAANGTATFTIASPVVLYARWTEQSGSNPFNPGGTQTENNLEPTTGVEPTQAPSDIVTNLDKLDNRVGISDNGVVVVLDNGLSEPVKFRDNPPDNVLISLPSQKSLDVQMNGNTLNITIDPETPNPPKQTILSTTTLLLSNGTEQKGLQLVQGEAAITNEEPGSTLGGLELSKDSTLRGLVAEAGPAGGSVGFKKTLDGAGSVSAEWGEINITVRLKGSGVSTLQAVVTEDGMRGTLSALVTDTVMLTLKAGEVARFDTEGELIGVFLGSLSGTAGKTGDLMPFIKPAGLTLYPASTFIFEGGNVLGRINARFSDFLEEKLGTLQFTQRSDGLLEVRSATSEFYARTLHGFEVVDGAQDGVTANADGSLSLVYDGIRTTYQPMLEHVADLAEYVDTLHFTTAVLDSGVVLVSSTTDNRRYAGRPRYVLLPPAMTTRGVSPALDAKTSVLYTNSAGERQQLDPALFDEAQVRAAAAAQGWTLAHSGAGGNDLQVRSPTGQTYSVMPDFNVEVLDSVSPYAGTFRTEGQRVYFYYSGHMLRQGFTLK